jgi:hypothetical protein
MAQDEPLSLAKKITFSVISFFSLVVLLELISSIILIYRYRLTNNYTALLNESSISSLVNVAHKAAARLGLATTTGVYEYSTSANPSPFLVPDKDLGRSHKPGKYIITFSRKPRTSSEWERIETKVTINEDGSRWTGATPAGQNLPSIYIFGDSFVFGWGVNDEQTFAYLVQQALPGYKVNLLAREGYALSETLLQFKKIATRINERDIIILGYGDYYDKRNVVAPSWLREIESFFASRHVEVQFDLFLPKVSLNQDGSIRVSMVQQDCKHNRTYCDQKDPDNIEESAVTRAIINFIAANTDAKIYLLHFDGDSKNPALTGLLPNVSLISALPGDFSYVIYDDVMGFDRHPGPYWHYAISRRLIETLRFPAKP